MQKSIRILIMIMSVLLMALPTLAQNVNIPLGDIPSSQRVVITYDVTVNDNLPQGLPYIANQGTVTGNGFGSVLSDDPDTSDIADETRTQVGFTLGVIELPNTGESSLWFSVILSLIVAVVGTAIIGGAYAVWQRR